MSRKPLVTSASPGAPTMVGDDAGLDEESGSDAPRKRTTRESYFVMSLARGLAVLRAFTPERTELTLSEIAAEAGVSNPSALRIGHTLVELGFLTRNPLTKGYRIGPGVLTLGVASLASMSLLEIAEPYLAQLRDESGETVKMAVLHRSEMVYVARLQSTKHAPSGSGYVGSRLPASQTCTGRAILATFSDDDARQILEQSTMRMYTNRSLTTIDAVMDELAATRARGYSINDQGTTLEHRSVAVALTSLSGYVAGAINISVSSNRMTVEQLCHDHAPTLLATAARISALLPHDPPHDIRSYLGPRPPLAAVR